MSVRMTIELPNQQGATVVRHALNGYKMRLQGGIKRTKRRLQKFEQCYHVTTAYFLSTMTAEDLSGGDMEYVEWAGEAGLLEGLESELKELENARYELS